MINRSVSDFLSGVSVGEYLAIFVGAVFLSAWLLGFLWVLRDRRVRAATRHIEWKLKEQEHCQIQSSLQQALDHAQQEISKLQEVLLEKEDILRDTEIMSVSQRVRLEEQEKAIAVEREHLFSVKQALANEFEALANRLFDRKQEQFFDIAKNNMEQIIAPFHHQLKTFYDRVEDAHKTDFAQRNQLIGRINELQKQSHQISLDAINLTNALKGSNKIMGTWGEIILSRLLEQSGLVKGREYEVQYSDLDENGKRRQPDVIVRLPDERDIIIDAKVSLLAYERMVSLDCPAEQDKALKAHLDSIRTHANSLSSKRYENLRNIRTLGFVFMFIPVETAYLTLVERKPELIEEAYRKNVVITSPSNLMMALRMIEALWQQDKQDRNVRKIVDSAGRVYDQFARFADGMGELGGSLQKAQESYELAIKRLCGGKGNLMRRMEELKDLGANSSRVIHPAIRAKSARYSEHLVEDE